MINISSSKSLIGQQDGEIQNNFFPVMKNLSSQNNIINPQKINNFAQGIYPQGRKNTDQIVETNISDSLKQIQEEKNKLRIDSSNLLAGSTNKNQYLSNDELIPYTYKSSQFQSNGNSQNQLAQDLHDRTDNLATFDDDNYDMQANRSQQISIPPSNQFHEYKSPNDQYIQPVQNTYQTPKQILTQIYGKQDNLKTNVNKVCNLEVDGKDGNGNKKQIKQPHQSGLLLERQAQDKLNNIRSVNLANMDRQKLKESNMVIDHSLTIKEFQHTYKFDGERGLNLYQVVQNRNLTVKDKQFIPIKISSILQTKWEIVQNFILEYKLSILLAAIIFFFSYGNYKDDPSQILLGLLLLWVLLVSHRKTYDEHQSEKIMRFMNEFIPQTCTVIREGQEQTVLTQSIVIGDIIILSNNSRVPVDCRVYSINNDTNTSSTSNFKADFSLLFQEKLPRILNKTCNYPTNYLKSSNVVLQGAKIIEGSGTGIALMSANESYCTKTIIQMTSHQQSVKKQFNPIQSELNQFARLQSKIAIIIAIVFLLVSHLKFDQSILTSFIFAGCVLVAFVPEGLLTQLHLAKGMRQCCLPQCNQSSSSAHSFHINKYEQSIENLSQVNCICCNLSSFVDNQNTAVNGIWMYGTLIQSINDIILQQSHNLNNKTYQNLILGSVLANESSFYVSPQQCNKQEQEYLPYEAEGNHVDAALIRFCQLISDVNSIRQQYPKAVNERGNHVIIPSNSLSRVTTVIVEERTQHGDYVLYVKGSPEQVWKLCQFIEVNGQYQKITEDVKDQFNDAIKSFSMNGENVVAVAKLPLLRNDVSVGGNNFFFNLKNNLNINVSNLTLIGLISLSNPLQHSIEQSLLIAKASGTKIFIMTDNDPLTTFALAKKLGLISEAEVKANQVAVDDSGQIISAEWELQVKKAQSIIVNGMRLQQFTSLKNEKNNQKVLEWLNKKLCIFSNVNVQQKQYLVHYLRKLGYTIAIASDDIQDLPFISLADIAISGTKSTPLLARITDVQLLLNKRQSDIQSVLEAIEEGRSYHSNAKKIFAFAGSVKMAQIIPLIAYIILRIPLAISAMFMILMSCVTNFMPALSLAQEEPDIDTLLTPLTYSPPQIAQKYSPQITQKQLSKVGKQNRVATFKLFFYSYFFLGAIASAAGFCAFFTTMNHLGFPVKTTFGLFNHKGYTANKDIADAMGYDSDVYDNYLQVIIPHYDLSAHSAITPSMPYWNSLFMMPDGNCEEDIENYNPTHQFVDWNDLANANVDLRKFFVFCDEEDKKWKTALSWSHCDPTDYVNYSTLTENSACYTSEALNYGQTAYLLGLVFFQLSNCFALKSLKWSFVQTPFNRLLVASFIIQILLCVVLVQIPGIQLIFRTRPLHFWQWGIPAVPFSMLVLIHEEIRKYLARTYKWFNKIATF